MKNTFLKKIISVPASLAIIAALLVSPATLTGCTQTAKTSVEAEANPTPSGFKYSDVPKWDKKNAYVKVNKNKPYFSKKELKNRKSYEKYGKLDSYGRCTRATACIGTDLMPTKTRSAIGMIKPTGWHTVKYAGIDGNYLYNRCHLIGYQLTGENANEKNLITGTRYLNVDGMLPFEDEVADYLHSNPDDHVLYRVTPVFKGKDLVARGVLMEAESVEDSGRSVKFCVFCYNVQPGVTIDYSDGSSKGPEYTGSTPSTREKTENSRSRQNDSGKHTYVLNTSTKKFHRPSCSSIKQMSDKNKKTVKEKRKTLISEGYKPCKRCNP
ncbi:MAG: DNA/RNA non-specific endonuclease [Lachnospiraceae bacterium]|nr:DNA/RNA non-specific endonuclease [Lachnospiraceae bacterium]